MFIYSFPQNIDKYEGANFSNLIKEILPNIKYYTFNVVKKDNSVINLTFRWTEKVDNIVNNLLQYKYVLINYNLYPRNINIIEKELRWIIFKNIDNSFKCIARPLHKFYNLGEEIYIRSSENSDIGGDDSANSISTYVSSIKDNNTFMEDKEDGTLIQIFLNNTNDLPNTLDYSFNKEYVIFNTKNTLRTNIYSADFMYKKNSKDIAEKFYKIIKEIEQKYNDKATINLEYINPWIEEHVVKYDQDYIFVLDIRLVQSWKYLSYQERKNIVEKYFKDYDNIKVPKLNKIDKESEIEEKRKELYKEWWVCKKYEENNINFMKVKTYWYLDKWVPKDITVASVSLYDLFLLLSLGEVDTFFQKLDNSDTIKFLKQIWINSTDASKFKVYLNDTLEKLENNLVSLLEDIRKDLKDEFDKKIKKLNITEINKNIYYSKLKNNLSVRSNKIIDWIFRLQEFYNILEDKNDKTNVIKIEDLEEILNNPIEFQKKIIEIIYYKIMWLCQQKTRLLYKNLKIIMEEWLSAGNYINFLKKIVILNNQNVPKVTKDNISEKDLSILLMFFKEVYEKILNMKEQLNKRNFLLIFTRTIYSDIYNDLKKQWIDISEAEYRSLLWILSNSFTFKWKTWQIFVSLMQFLEDTNLSNKVNKEYVDNDIKKEIENLIKVSYSKKTDNKVSNTAFLTDVYKYNPNSILVDKDFIENIINRIL